MPFDWETDFYAATDWDRGAYVGGDDMPEHLATFFERVGVPDTVADVGCGPALVDFELAPRYPDTAFYGYDVAPSVVESNREQAAEAGLSNLSFAVDALPDLAIDREFDLVYCMATLYFVDDVERALTELYDRVAPGGHLVFNYPNRYTRTWVHEETSGEKREAFGLVGAGENLLSYDAIESVLGRRPESYWTAVGARGEPYASRRSPAVFVRKPASP
ncbi:class I SAM-dependent methyltransferase [Haloarchaeobius amylolyticus]|uniref:class I SAM-dependent methyltransferase n=1 Tax=Haloarchaeobius amylolyticus TaxID=1198296 RepID=UPI00226EF6BA|nr:class I SAM-dependent methyltransferase [Haloarchaeobius amylolyticus]